MLQRISKLREQYKDDKNLLNVLELCNLYFELNKLLIYDVTSEADYEVMTNLVNQITEKTLEYTEED